MKSTIISLLSFSCAILAQSCDPTSCLCRFSVGGNVLQGVIPSGTGSIQHEMVIISGSDSDTDETGTCSVTLDRGQGCCDQFNGTAVFIGPGCLQGSGVLDCGEQIPYTLSYFSTSIITVAAYTTIGVSTIVITIPTTLSTTQTSATITDTDTEVSITATAASYTDNLKERQLSSQSDDDSVSVGVAVDFAYVTLSTVITVTSNFTAYSTTDAVFTTTVTGTSTETTTTTVATTTAIVVENYTLQFGLEDGCAYIPFPFLDQETYPAQQAEICAQACDTTPCCVSFGYNYFPPCEDGDAYVYCILSADAYGGTGEMECGIGVGYDGCTIYQQGTVYQKS